VKRKAVSFIFFFYQLFLIYHFKSRVLAS
jgi:hypothetical protein